VNLFSRFSLKPAAPRDVEDLIYEIAEHRRESDFQALYLQMRKREVFVPIVKSSLPPGVAPGQTVTSTAEHPLSMRTVSAPDGSALIPCATRPDAQLLRDGYAGMPWESFLEMVLKSGVEIYGALLQGQGSWIAFDRQRVRQILVSAN
jgi:hypothetical protein